MLQVFRLPKTNQKYFLLQHKLFVRAKKFADKGMMAMWKPQNFNFSSQNFTPISENKFVPISK